MYSWFDLSGKRLSCGWLFGRFFMRLIGQYKPASSSLVMPVVWPAHRWISGSGPAFMLSLMDGFTYGFLAAALPAGSMALT